MRLRKYIVIMAGCLMVAEARAQDISFGKMKEVCRVPFTASTQVGPMKGVLGVCRLESSVSADVSLCVVVVYEKYWGPNILKILEQAHSPIVERTGDRISILYTSGVNTTCVTEFSVSSGVPKFVSTEAIAWNDRGTYRTSESFARYSHLLEERNKKPIQPPEPTAGLTPARVSPVTFGERR